MFEPWPPRGRREATKLSPHECARCGLRCSSRQQALALHTAGMLCPLLRARRVTLSACTPGALAGALLRILAVH